jgi:tetratricopeptide (TPR) repeat protein/G3E family GTPase
MKQQLPVLLVTGPAGGGKTRLINGLVAQASEPERIVVLRQPEGPLSLDLLLLADGVIPVDLGAGCACCGLADLPEALGAIVQERGVQLVLAEINDEQLAAAMLETLAADQQLRPGIIAVVRREGSHPPPHLAEADWLVVADEEAHDPHRAAAQVPGPRRVTLEQLLGGGGIDQLVSGLRERAARSHVLNSGHHHDEDSHEDRGWYPFFSRAALDEGDLRRALASLADLPLRGKGILRFAGASAPASAVFSGDGLELRELGWRHLPAVWELQSLACGESPLDLCWLEDASVFYLWVAPTADRDAVSLERRLHAALASCLGLDEANRPPGELARELFGQELFLEGLTWARAAVAAHPASVPEIALLAKLYHRLGENGRAFALLYEALRQQPEDRSTLLNLARLHLAYGELAEARQAAGRALAAHGADVETRSVMGQVLLQTGELADGVQLLREVLLEQPAAPELLRLLSNGCAELGELEEAIGYQARLLELAPDDGGALYLHGHLLLRAGRPDEGQRFLERALESDNETAWVYLSLGICLLQLGSPDQARECFVESRHCARQMLETTDDDPSFLVDQILAEAACGEPELARSTIAILRDHAPEPVLAEALPHLREMLGLLVALPGVSELLAGLSAP